MATTNTIVLSSSPSHPVVNVTPPRGITTAMSSSPSLPSPSQLFSSMPLHLSSGSRAAPIPTDAVAGFASASSLLHGARSVDGSGSTGSVKRLGLAERFNSQHRGKGPAKPRTEKAEKEKEEAPVFKKLRALPVEDSETIKENTERADVDAPKNNAKTNGNLAKKPRKKKSKDECEGQTKIKKTNITKPGTSKSVAKTKKVSTTTKKAKASAAETFNTLLPSQEEDRKAREEFRDLCLEKVIPIRRDWTPCKDTALSHAAHGDAIILSTSVHLADTPTAKAPPAGRFGQLLGEFGFAKNNDSLGIRSEPMRLVSDEAVVKKRKIELVNGVLAPPQVEKSKRAKSPKKKPQTITEKATAPFVPVEALGASSLLQYLGAPMTGEPAATGQADDSGTPATVRAKSPVKRIPKSKAVVSKAKKQTQPVLLSPESALKNARAQELTFGTSSQLAREESPTLLKDIQRAMDESASMSPECLPPALPSGKFRSSNSLALVRSRNLWSVASRDLTGSLLDVEVVDLADTPRPQKPSPDPQPAAVESDAMNPTPLTIESSEHSNVVKHDLSPPKLNSEATPALQQQLHEPELVIPRSVAETALKARPKSRAPVKNATDPKTDPNQMPTYQGFTDAQLSKEVAAYGFKSIKKRVAMITLLEECWESKVSMALQEVEANLKPPLPSTVPADAEGSKQAGSGRKRGRPPKNTAMMGAAATTGDYATPKKPRGRPRKDSVATAPSPKRKRKAISPSKAQSEAAALGGDEIYDSSPPTPSPPRRRSPPKSPNQLQLSKSTVASANLNFTVGKEDQTQLFAQITKAITSFPPTNDPKNLTFNEKILIYEPVVLEDLTAWLNTEGLGTVGEDDEVWPELVKEWCEERSVCCLWRENLRGGTRGRW